MMRTLLLVAAICSVFVFGLASASCKGDTWVENGIRYNCTGGQGAAVSCVVRKDDASIPHEHSISRFNEKEDTYEDVPFGVTRVIKNGCLSKRVCIESVIYKCRNEGGKPSLEAIPCDGVEQWSCQDFGSIQATAFAHAGPDSEKQEGYPKVMEGDRPGVFAIQFVTGGEKKMFPCRDLTTLWKGSENGHLASKSMSAQPKTCEDKKFF